MRNENSYARFAELYDAMAADDPDRRSFFSTLLRDRQVKILLDRARGTGSDALLFYSPGYDISASDISQSVLSVAQQKIRPGKIDIPLRPADFHRLSQRYDQRFDAVVCLSNARSEVHVNVVEALRSVAGVLAPDGIIVLDRSQTDFSLKNPSRFVSLVNNRSLSRLSAIDYQADPMTVRVCDFLHDKATASYNYLQGDSNIRLRPIAVFGRTG